MFPLNPLASADTYKFGHWKMDPAGVTEKSGYIEPRGGLTAEVVNFGLQAYIKSYLMRPYTHEMVDEAKSIMDAHVRPGFFNEAGFRYIVDQYGGRAPLEIQAAPEGSLILPGNVQVQVRSTDPQLAWFATWVETQMLRAIWYPSTVATLSREAKKVIMAGLQITADEPEEAIWFKLHDFGGRGASSGESAMLGGMGHLVNFMGTDNVEALVGARRFYHEDCAGFSVPASEHSIATTWGPDREVDYVRHMIREFDAPDALFSIVGDSYDIFSFVKNVIGDQLKDDVLALQGKLVIRPDSGDPTKMPIETIEMVMDKFGHGETQKGYRTLPKQVGVIQGDQTDKARLQTTIAAMIDRGLDVNNLVWGMGGALLQGVGRDDHKYAMKANEVVEDGRRIAIKKDPITDQGKVSKAGRLALIDSCGIGGCSQSTVAEAELLDPKRNLLQTVYRDGVLLEDVTFADVRKRAQV